MIFICLCVKRYSFRYSCPQYKKPPARNSIHLLASSLSKCFQRRQIEIIYQILCMFKSHLSRMKHREGKLWDHWILLHWGDQVQHKVTTCVEWCSAVPWLIRVALKCFPSGWGYGNCLGWPFICTTTLFLGQAKQSGWRLLGLCCYPEWIASDKKVGSFRTDLDVSALDLPRPYKHKGLILARAKGITQNHTNNLPVNMVTAR